MKQPAMGQHPAASCGARNECSQGGCAAKEQPEVIKVPILLGPTAVGKTELSLSLALETGAEIISADSRQVYRYLDIGTAKPTPEERAQVRHHLIDIRNPDEQYSAADFARDAVGLIRRLAAGGKRCLVVGGSGLYLRALTQGLFVGPPGDAVVRSRLLREAKEKGITHLRCRLQVVDPRGAERIRPNDLQRTLRALEVWELTGEPISELQETRTEKPKDFEFLFVGVARARPELYHRIESRVDRMIESGLLAEVRGILDRGYSSELNSLRSVGYQETIAYLQRGTSWPETVRLIKRNSRRYAKRELTWFRKESEIQWIDLGESEEKEEAEERIRRIVEAFWASGTGPFCA